MRHAISAELLRKLFWLAVFGVSAALAAPVRTAKKPVKIEYHGERVIDPYQWLENAENSAVQRWTDQQNKVAREFLDKLPTRRSLEYEFRKLYGHASADFSALSVRSNRVFALKLKPPAEQASLVAMRSLAETNSDRTIFDPGTTSSIDFYEPSLDGRYVAVSLSENG